MRICITGFYGWNCNGDEGILQAIIDSIGTEHEYIVCTSFPYNANLPYNTFAEYKAKLPLSVVEIRQIYDIRSDYDAFILGGGGLGWGFGWRQAITAFCAEKPAMNYGVGYKIEELYNPRLNALYLTFLHLFDAITVRDRYSQGIANGISGALGIPLPTTLTGCPSLNLKEEKFDCPTNMIAVCPRYEDYPIGNTEQLDWLTERLKDVSDEVLLIPFAPYNAENMPVDLVLCVELRRRLKNARILGTDGFSPRKVKYAISKSKLVITGGRYHAIVWASAHNVPFEVCPTCWHYPKVGAFEKMHAEFGDEKLKEMEKDNVKIFKGMFEK